MYEIICNSILKNLLDEVNEAIANGYTPVGGITPVYHKDKLLEYKLNVVDFNSEKFNQYVTFMQTLYKPQTKELL